MRFQALYDDGLACLRFLTRLPWPPAVRPDGARLLPAALVPVAGLMIGLCPAAVLEVALALDLTPNLAAALAIAGLVAVTGALHEDGLADCADGFGGGWDRDGKLAIMRDSRIGTYGVCALVLSLLIRTLAIGALAGRAPIAAAASLVVVAAWSRTACLLPLIVLPPARRDGLGASALPPTWREMMPAGLICLVAWLCLPMCGIPVTRALAALVLAPAAAIGVCRLARHQIGGHTGDVAGAAQQAAEIAALLALATA